MKTVQLIEITSRECKNYLAEGGDLAIVPVGSFERLGPHLPLGARSYVVYALSEEIARGNNGYCLPVIPYSTCYDTAGQKGTIDIDHNTLYKLCYDITNELVANGFRRIIFISYVKEFYYLVAEYFQNENIAIAWISPDQIPLERAKDRDEKETSMLAACLKLTDNMKVLDRLMDENRKHRSSCQGTDRETTLVNELNKLGKLGYGYPRSQYNILPVENIYVDEAIEAIRHWVELRKPSVAALKGYNYYLARGRHDRGLK